MQIKEQLYQQQDTTYQAFQKRIIVHDESVIGVRMPILRKLAKQLVKQEGIKALRYLSEDTYEERLLQGMIIGYAKLSLEERLAYVRKHVPKINNWALCDLFCGDLKFTKEHKEAMLSFLHPYLKSEQPYAIRFGVVMLLVYYVEPVYCEQAFAYFDTIKNDDYYVKMAVAWAISRYYVGVKEKTMAYLKENQLDDFTYHKALSKIIDSLVVSKEEKAVIRKMKRKK